MSNLLGAIPLVLEVSCLRVPFLNFIRDSIERHDSFHEHGGDSGSEETDQDIVVRDAGTSGVALECQDITFERREELPILLGHSLSSQPRDSIPGCVLMLKGLLELLEKVVPGSKGNGSAINGVLLEGFGPGLGRAFGHV